MLDDKANGDAQTVHQKCCAHHDWKRAGIEPRLLDVLADPLIQAVMRSDGVRRRALKITIAKVQRQLKRREGVVDDHIQPRPARKWYDVF